MIHVAVLDDHPLVLAVLQETVGRTLRPTPDTYCRRCHATFQRPLPRPYGAICPACFTDGEIFTLTDAPPRRMSSLHATGADGGARALGEGASDA